MDTQVADLLGGERVLGTSVNSNLDLARATREGLPAETALQLAELILGVPVRQNRPKPRRHRGPKITLRDLEVKAEPVSRPTMGPLGSLISSMPYTLSPAKAGYVRKSTSPARLTPEQSDVVVRTASALAKAIDTLGDREKAVHWLTSSNRALGGEVPIALLDTSAGAHEVEAVLDRVEYGVYS
jgi:uncharacterized protein (DUF2384 family)